MPRKIKQNKKRKNRRAKLKTKNKNKQRWPCCLEMLVSPAS
jgi:hypothetical protein